MEIEETGLEGVRLLVPRPLHDHRGVFSEIYNRKVLAEHGVDIAFVQDNHSLSRAACTVRGLHFQAPPHAQDKLVRCARGRLFDVAVDIRTGSPSYGRWAGRELSFENRRQMLVPAGFAHGFMTLETETEIVYKCSDYYAPETEGALLWNDPDIGIDWPLSGTDAVISERDAQAPGIAGYESPFSYGSAA